MTPAEQRLPSSSARVSRGVAATLGSLALHTLPISLAYGLQAAVVALSWWSCVGGDYISKEQGFGLVLSVLLFVAANYALVGMARVAWRRPGRSAWLTRYLVVGVATGLLFVWANVRYYHLTQHGCTDGLPNWWPAWLPAA